jgi:hypothetical protein
MDIDFETFDRVWRTALVWYPEKTGTWQHPSLFSRQTNLLAVFPTFWRQRKQTCFATFVIWNNQTEVMIMDGDAPGASDEILEQGPRQRGTHVGSPTQRAWWRPSQLNEHEDSRFYGRCNSEFCFR